MWDLWQDDLHPETLTALAVGGDVVLEGYNVQTVTVGRGATQVGAEGAGAVRAHASGPLTDAVHDGQTVIHRGHVYEVDGPPRHYTGGPLDHTEIALVERFPAQWLTNVVVLRSERDPRGHPMPDQRIPVTDCLVRWLSSTEEVDRSNVASGTAVLYRRRRDGFEFLSTDRIEVPQTALAPGVWHVDGDPKRWPNTVQLDLTKGE
ncbi:hypothetical protein [Georgenia wangjunii]|uniref:hypothetical protein n=1 Tax=Georgenia wangjunii TaxID=3117730 RepID=UPI002F2661C4